MPEPLRIEITPSEHVTANVYAPASPEAGASLILAHGAGTNQASPLMMRFARGLAARGLETITFNFLYTEQRRRLPDKNDRLELCYRRVIDAVRDRIAPRGAERGTLVVGGRSMGGRIASQVAARAGEGIDGIVLLGYPLHPPGRPEKLRTKHLAAIRAPMLFVQGARDAFGTPDELAPFIGTLRSELIVIENGDHSFKVPKGAAVTQDAVYEFVLETVAAWVRRLK
jgi:predicted alpha/beta-hydrolase family hydrolase